MFFLCVCIWLEHQLPSLFSIRNNHSIHFNETVFAICIIPSLVMMTFQLFLLYHQQCQ